MTYKNIPFWKAIKVQMIHIASSLVYNAQIVFKIKTSPVTLEEQKRGPGWEVNN